MKNETVSKNQVDGMAEKQKRGIVCTMFLLLLKAVCLPLIVILAFIERILILLVSLVQYVSGFILLAGVVLGFIEIKDNGFHMAALWLPLLISFIGFMLPIIGLSFPVALGIARAKITDFVFPS